jgi:hypothetical protein
MRINSDIINHEIFILQERAPGGKGWQVRDFPASMYGEPSDWTRNGGQSVAPFAYEFSACGACWQQTGEFGSFDYDKALSAFAALLKHSPDKEFRLCHRKCVITTIPILCGSGWGQK